ncbi:hypothetical protein [Pedobacter sp. SYSU D00535]|uniref:hypothetical protein n=1 Tax=Pedobacter sp. SYSU D00535 TaxID=2810308 RepID=UPI001A9678A2|nr:hypothetical protein [Pedobacter sp. SYSU D00535]
MMNTFTINSLKLARKVYGKVFSAETHLTEVYKIHSYQDASDLIAEKLLNDKPAMIARFGAVELNCLANYVSVVNHRNDFLGYIRGKVHHFWWDVNTITNMSDNAGFFPSNPKNLTMFAELMLEDMKEVDVLGSWLSQELFFHDKLAHVERVRLLDLEPYYHERPWSQALEGKKVLVVHPFEDSIRKQYSKRELLFEDRNVLPEFELKTLRAVQSIANNKTGFKTWFHALQHMQDRISETDFDIAIIGCGAYGFPLAAHVKRLGKKAVHLGGATQTLFGIKGKRWEKKKTHEGVSKMMNEHWSRPLSTETPSGIQKVEGGCYW